jgi:hypothetical protein
LRFCRAQDLRLLGGKQIGVQVSLEPGLEDFLSPGADKDGSLVTVVSRLVLALRAFVAAGTVYLYRPGNPQVDAAEPADLAGLHASKPL